MKVCFIGKFFYREKNGGIETYSQSIIEGLKKDINFFCVFHGTSRKIKRFKSFKVLFLKQIFNLFGDPISCLPFSKISRERCDIVHLNIPQPFTELQLLLYFLIRGKREKILLTYHAEIPHYSIMHWLFDFFRMFWHIPLLFISDKIIVTSRQYLDGSFILRHFRKKIEIIPLSANERELKEMVNVKKIKAKYKLANKKVLLFVGRLIEYKGLKYLIRSMKNVVNEVDNNVVLLIVGDGPLFNELKKIVNELNLNHHVIFTGNIPSKERNALYKISDIVILPSINKGEAFGLSLLEGMYFSKPLVSTNIRGSGVNFVNIDKVTGFVVQPRNHAELAEKIIILLKNKNIRKKFGKNARKRYLDVFSQRKMLFKTLKIYQKLIKNGRIEKNN